MQVAAKTMPVGSLIVGIDLVPIRPVRGTISLQGDITTAEARTSIRKASEGARFDAVVCDGAPNVGGAWSSEAYAQNALALEAAKLATDVLAPGGTFVTKIFRSSDYGSLLYAFRALFDRVEAVKPPASRSTSAEIFAVCLGYRAPEKIDPRLLDPKHLFAQAEAAPVPLGPDALLRLKAKAKRHREGYEDGIATTHRSMPAAAFVCGASPVTALGAATKIALDGPDAYAPVAEKLAARGADAADAAAADDDEDPSIASARAADAEALKAAAASGGSLAQLAAADDADLRADEGEEGEGDASAKAKAGAKGKDGAAPGAFAVERVRELAAQAASAKGGASAAPARLLASLIASHPATTEEIRQYCSDLGVLGRSEFKTLLRWRLAVRKDLDGALKLARAAAASRRRRERAARREAGEEDVSSDSEDEDEAARGAARRQASLDPEEALLRDLEAAKDRAAKEKKRLRRKRLEAAQKARVRAAQMAETAGMGEEEGGGLFDLRAVKNVREGDVRVQDVDTAVGEEEGDEQGSSESSDDGAGSDAASDSDDEEARRLARLESEMDEQYGAWKLRNKARTAAAARAEALAALPRRRRKLAEKGGELEKDKALREAGYKSDEDDDDAEDVDAVDETDAGGSGLVKDLEGVRAAAKARLASAADAWFEQDIFGDDGVDGGLLKEEEMREEEGEEDAELAALQGAEGLDDLPEDTEHPGESKDVPKDAKKGAAKRGASKPAPPAKAGAAASFADAPLEDADFEVVPASSSARDADSEGDSDGGDSDGEFELLPEEEKAQMIALARKMVSRKVKDRLIEAAYSKWAFHDENLPAWFEDDQKTYVRPHPELSPEEIEAAKEELRALDARPIKKVAEAKARRKARLASRLAKARQKAESIAAQEDVSAAAKMREIEKLYSQARQGKGAKKTRGRDGRDGKRKGPPLDKRMKKDKRGQEAAVRRLKRKRR